MRVLYHFPTSPFSRRTRLALSHKGLPVELRDARATPSFLDEARTYSPLRTVPVLVDENGVALADSTVIAHYLDAAYPSTRPLWPLGRDAHWMYETAALVDFALNTLVDLGSRYFELRDSPSWGKVTLEMVGRAQRALDALGEIAERLEGGTVVASGWSAADMWLLTATLWLEGLPERRGANPNVAQILSLGWTLPPAMSQWADPYRVMADEFFRAG